MGISIYCQLVQFFPQPTAGR